MKKIIQGTRWDTDSADMVCRIEEGGQGDFRMIRAGLYCTKRSKRFFLAGFGGAMTVFASRSSDGSWTGGEGVIPLETEDARAYAEKYASAEEIERFFPVEDADAGPYKLKVKITVSDKYMGGFEKWVEVGSQEEFDTLKAEWSRYPQTRDFSTTVILNWMGEDGPKNLQLL